MRNPWKIIIILILASSVIAVILLKDSCPGVSCRTEFKNQAIPVAAEPAKLPRLIDLGADKCIPCKMMMPILEELDKEYKGKLQVEFYDIWKNPAPGQQYGIRVIPTQIFIDPNGKEIFRHEGYFSKEDILAKWKALGFDLSE